MTARNHQIGGDHYTSKARPLTPLSPERIAELQHRESFMERWAGLVPDDTKGAE